MIDCSISPGFCARARRGVDMRSALRKPLAVVQPNPGSTARPASSQNEVTVLFDDTAVTFPIPVELTLADLATRLAEANAARRSRMVRVAIKVSSDTIKP
jgi:hypothetical protein